MDYEIEVSHKDHFALGVSLDFRAEGSHVYTLGNKKESKFTIRSQKVRQGKLSEEYPLEAHVIAVEMETAEFSSGHGGYTYSVPGRAGQPSTVYSVPGSSVGSSYQWHLMKTIVGDTLYGLSTPAAWLRIGTYAFKQTKGGFEVRYNDETGKLRTEILTIRSEEPAPKQ
jgi:hypothetical protein